MSNKYRNYVKQTIRKIKVKHNLKKIIKVNIKTNKKYRICVHAFFYTYSTFFEKCFNGVQNRFYKFTRKFIM